MAALVACNDGGNPDIIINRDPNPGGNGGGTTGTGDDPGKQAGVCYPAFQDDELNVVTWNIQGLDMDENTFNDGGTDLNKLKELIENLDADIIAVQEIYDIPSFNLLANSLSEFTAYSINVRGSLELGFLVKTDAFLEIGSPFVAVNTSPRETIGLKVKHASGLEVTFLNLHLKCCGNSGDITSRTIASNTLKSYLDDNLPGEAVIILGDFNDDYDDGPFDSFINDPSNYRFADANVTVPSYPSWPSDLDHILVTNELFDLITDARTLTVNSCVSNYYNDVSDHRPVLASFK